MNVKVAALCPLAGIGVTMVTSAYCDITCLASIELFKSSDKKYFFNIYHGQHIKSNINKNMIKISQYHSIPYCAARFESNDLVSLSVEAHF